MFEVGQEVEIQSGLFEGEVGTYDGAAKTGPWVKHPVTDTTPERRLWYSSSDLKVLA